MAVPPKSLNIDIKNYKASIEKWTIILDRTHSWGTPERVTLGPSAAPSHKIEHDMIKMGDFMLRTFNAHWTGPDFEPQVLIDFLRKLPSLSNLEWRSYDLMPPLLELLRDELSNCKIHLKPFYISYDAEPSYPRRLILCLPSLRTIWYKRDFDDCVENIVQHMARASNGNIREVRIFWGFRGASPFPVPAPLMWRQELAPLDCQRLGQLQCLQLSGNGRDGLNLEIWARHTDFAYLRALSLEMCVTGADLETLINLPVQSLHSLGMVLDDTSDPYSATLQTLFCNLPSLLHLRLTGGLPSLYLQAILNQLDSTLHTLYLIPQGTDPCRFVFDSSTLALVTDRCKHVKDLAISIRRSWNKPGKDIAVLKAIGRMPHLANLNLTLDTYTMPFHYNENNEPARLAPSDPSFSAFDAEPFPSSEGWLRNGHIRDALINSAIDADLAKAIFSTILSGTPDGETPSLRRLSLKASSENPSIYSGVGEVAEEIGREWVVERSGLDEVVEVRRVEVDDERFELPEWPTYDVELVFRSIWPGDGNWFNEWHSFPLIQQ
ncbi:hypothetical protein DM02DRAFT_732867 [Periconia macrospinosa]|uniref:Uncharacterized protein n=1 Tax=Periconia macrospinosa TaxID=97972 RepID=A0A2V1D754_9PLEO|nr:hypothetical protein DM02DRAFT_732867 [Periconia macrospinosa]